MFKLKTHFDAHYNGIKLVVFDQDGNKLASKKPKRKRSHFLFEKSELSDGTSPINISLKLIDINKKKSNTSINKTDYTLSSKRQIFDLTVPAQKDNYKLTINPQLTNVGSAIILDDFNAGRSILIGNSNPAVITQPNFDDAKFPAKDSKTNLEIIGTPNFDDIGVPTKDPTSNLDTIKNPSFNDNKVPTESPIPRSKYLAFSGGGFNSHSFLSGMFAGALDNLQTEGEAQPSKNINLNDEQILFDPSKGRSLKRLTSNIAGISGNSGGSWFLTALAFSKEFSSAFESKPQTDRFLETGYYGQLRKILEQDVFTGNNSVNDSNLRQLVDGGVGYVKYLSTVADWQWSEVVKNITYGPYNMKSKFADKEFYDRLKWAKNIDIVINSSLFQQDAIVYGDKGIGGLRDIHSRVSTPSHEPTGNFVTPISFINYGSLEGELTDSAHMKILAGANGAIELRKERTIGNEYSSIDLSSDDDDRFYLHDSNIIDPSIASSAAFAMLASHHQFSIFPEKLVSSKLSKLAPLAAIDVDSSDFMLAPEIPIRKNDYNGVWDDVQSNGYTRVTDGGYTDNTSAANLMRFIQDENGIDKPFEMAIFKQASIPLNKADDKNNDVIPVGNTSISADLAGLFGADGGFNQRDGDLVEFCTAIGCLDVVTSQVFDQSAWIGVKSPKWEYASGSNIFVRYFELDVITVDNDAFGVEGGQRGKVRIFYSNNSESMASPKSMGQYEEYENNFNAYREIIKEELPFNDLKDAFGL